MSNTITYKNPTEPPIFPVYKDSTDSQFKMNVGGKIISKSLLSDILFDDWLRLDDKSDDTNILYYGFAEPGTATSASTWAIMRQTINGAAVTREWANGSQERNVSWDNRETLSYS